MRLELCGYFDNNFGDDYMQKVILHNMGEFDFYADKKSMISPIVLEEENLKAADVGEMQNLPKLMAVGSGFMINSGRDLKYELVCFLKSIRAADYCIGCNIEPFGNKFAEWLVIQKLKKFKYIICRDKKSLRWLKKNCPKVNAAYMPDIMFFIPSSWLPAKKEGGKLGIELMHRSGDESGNAYYKSMAEAADFWIEKTSGGVLLMAFDTGKEDDVFSCECVKAMMKYTERAEIVKHGSRGEIFNAYASCSKIIGARFHSAVLAMKMNVDFYPIIYREKMRNLIFDMRYPIKGCDISDVDLNGIKEFLQSEKVDFCLEKSYVLQEEKSFIEFKNLIKKDLSQKAEGYDV